MAKRRTYTFSADLEDIADIVGERLLVVARTSMDDLIDDAQTPGVSAASVRRDIADGIKGGNGRRSKKLFGPIIKPMNKGGRMRVDTGFLRASGAISYTGMPTGPERGEPDQRYDYEVSVTRDKLETLELGNTIYFGWTASYARIREAYDGFLEGALQNWSKYVNRNVEIARERIK